MRPHVRRFVAAGFVLTAILAATLPAAAELAWSAHAAYAVGGAAAPAALVPGFRQALDISLGIGEREVHGNRDGMWSSHNGFLFGGSGVIGFETYPSYVVAEATSFYDTTLAGFSASGGVVVRVDPDPGAGLGFRVNGDFFMINVGGRLVSVFAPGPEIVGLFTIGVGRF